MCSYAATELSWQDFVPARFAACFETALSYVNKQHAVCIVIHIVHAYCNHLQRRCCQLSVNVFLSFKPLSLSLFKPRNILLGGSRLHSSFQWVKLFDSQASALVYSHDVSSGCRLLNLHLL